MNCLNGIIRRITGVEKQYLRGRFETKLLTIPGLIGVFLQGDLLASKLYSYLPEKNIAALPIWMEAENQWVCFYKSSL